MTKYDVRPMVRDDYYALVGQTPEAHLWGMMEAQLDTLLASDSWTGTIDGRVVACGGLVHIWPGLAEAWIALTPLALEHPTFLYRQTRRFLDHAIQTHALRRIEAHVRADFIDAQRFVAHLGFTFNAFLSKYGPHGEPFLLYAKVL